METVYLLGAGASKPAGLPTASELTARTLDSLKLKHPARGDMRNLALNYAVSVLMHSNVKQGSSATDLPNIELLVSAIELLSERETLEISPFVYQWDPFIADLESRRNPPSFLEAIVNNGKTRDWQEIRGGPAPTKFEWFHRLLVDLVQMLATELKTPAQADLSYLTPILEQAREQKLTIASLNYDLVIEDACRNLGIGCSQGVQNWAQDWALTWSNVGVRLLKLHGSIDWGRSVPTDDSKQQVIPEVVLSLDQDDQDFLPFVIYGQREKLRPQGPFLDLRNEFVSSLRAATYLIVIGYSFGDDHVNTIITRWINTSSDHRMIIIDPNFPVFHALMEDDFRKNLIWSTTSGACLEEDRQVIVIRKSVEAVAPHISQTAEGLNNLFSKSHETNYFK